MQSSAPHKRLHYLSDPTEEMIAMSRPQPVPNKRPKLSLQTNALPITFGKSTTTHSIPSSAVNAASPTILNTFKNAYELPQRPSPTTRSPSAPRSARLSSKKMTNYISRHGSDWPYGVPYGIKGILRNTPIPPTSRRTSVCSSSASPRNGRRAFFPPARRVAFRTHLEEEIKTVKFVARHSDISSSEESDSDYSSTGVPSDLDEESKDLKSEVDDQLSSMKRKRSHSKLIRAAAIRDGLDDSAAASLPPRTPSSRRKRRRWEWTLGPIREDVEAKKQAEGPAQGRPRPPMTSAIGYWPSIT